MRRSTSLTMSIKNNYDFVHIVMTYDILSSLYYIVSGEKRNISVHITHTMCLLLNACYNCTSIVSRRRRSWNRSRAECAEGGWGSRRVFMPNLRFCGHALKIHYEYWFLRTTNIVFNTEGEGTQPGGCEHKDNFGKYTYTDIARKTEYPTVWRFSHNRGRLYTRLYFSIYGKQ